MTSGSAAASPRRVRRIHDKHRCKFQCDTIFVIGTVEVKVPEGELPEVGIQYTPKYGLFSQVDEEISRDEICMSIQMVEF